MESILGIISFLIAVGIILYNIKDQRSGDKDLYGGRIKLYGAAIILIMLGIVLMIRHFNE